MSRVRLLFSEAWSSIRQNISTTFAATMTVLIGMFLLGLFIALGTWVLSWSDHVKKELTVKVFFCIGARRPRQVQEYAVRQKLIKDPRVKTIVFVSKEQAREDDGEEVPGAVRDTAAVEPAAGLVGDHADEGASTRRRSASGDPRGAAIPGVGTTCAGGSKTAHRVLTIAEVIWLVFLVAVDPARHRVDASDREHDPALDLRAAA